MAFIISVIGSNPGRPFGKGPMAGQPGRATIATLTCPSCHQRRDYDPADIVVQPAEVMNGKG
ncbi:MAG: hypothetical protein M3003_13920 [Candidatus Dormibacteraeota bacterium]|nr:hypothetical protein [Candidatus Dormibacteraeota bacterium]